jgi:hypothetical protein
MEKSGSGLPDVSCYGYDWSIVVFLASGGNWC